MIIGIDFDNTLINYEGLFYRAAHKKNWLDSSCQTRACIKQRLIKEDGNDLRWQYLQKEVYSRLIEEAEPFHGVLEFIRNKLDSGDKIYIVSHKTRFSNLDGKTDLIQPALKWLIKNKIIAGSSSIDHNQILLDRNNIFFCETRSEKIDTIRNLACDVFIDDLPQVLNDPDFPEGVLKILFGNNISDNNNKTDCLILEVPSWQAINVISQLKKCYSNEFICELYKTINYVPEHYKVCNEGGNHNAFIISSGNETLFIKVAEPEKSAQLKKEYEALHFLHERGIKNIPETRHFSEKQGFLVQAAISGKKINSVNQVSILEVIGFIQKLDSVRDTFRPASQSRKKLKDYPRALELRLDRIFSGIETMHKHHPELMMIKNLIEDKLLPLKQIVEKHYNKLLHRFKLNENYIFSEHERILNPSDFGFHNALLDNNNRIVFLDFEYFGWDDKIKMVSDFIHHPGHSLTAEQQVFFIRQLKKTGFLTPELLNRLRTVIDLIGLEWVLIILNVAQVDKLKQKKSAFSELSVSELITRQYNKASDLLDQYATHYSNNRECITLGLNWNEITR